ncbi:hypothetical protein RhiirB3_457668 [Rhizophagus irregularis]|nr:hypothetical protein RhiirB3_457668 [Rhizophagus irregularis]
MLKIGKKWCEKQWLFLAILGYSWLFLAICDVTGGSPQQDAATILVTRLMVTMSVRT